MIWVWIAYNCTQADKPYKAVQQGELSITKWHCENILLLLCPCCEKQGLVRYCVSEKSSGKECISRCISGDFSCVRPVTMVGAGSATVCWVRLMIRFQFLLLIIFGNSFSCLGGNLPCCGLVFERGFQWGSAVSDKEIVAITSCLCVSV